MNAFEYKEKYFTGKMQSWTDMSYGTIQPALAVALKDSKIQEGVRILDLGCGAGVYLKTLREYGTSIVGVDHAIEGILLSNPDVEVSRIVADACSLPIKDREIDLIFSTEVLEHILDTDAALREMHRTLVDGGRLILTTTLYYSSINTYLSQAIIDRHSLFQVSCNLAHYVGGYISTKLQESFIRKWCFERLGGHYHGFRTSRLKKLLRTAGFNVVESKPLYIFEPIGFSKYTSVSAAFGDLSFSKALLLSPAILLIKFLNCFLKLSKLGANNIFLVCQKPENGKKHTETAKAVDGHPSGFVDILCCPVTRQSLYFESDPVTDQVSEVPKQAASEEPFHGIMKSSTNGALIRDDKLVSYKVFHGIPIFTETYSIGP